MAKQTVVGVAVAIVIVACGGTQNLAVAKFRRDYACESLLDVSGGGGHVEVSGCGRTAHYLCQHRELEEQPGVVRRVCAEQTSWDNQDPDEGSSPSGSTWFRTTNGGRVAVSEADDAGAFQLVVEQLVENEPDVCAFSLFANRAAVGQSQAGRVGSFSPPRYQASVHLAPLVTTPLVSLSGTLCKQDWIVDPQQLERLQSLLRSFKVPGTSDSESVSGRSSQSAGGESPDLPEDGSSQPPPGEPSEPPEEASSPAAPDAPQ